MGLENKNEKQSYFKNGTTVKPTGIDIPEGKKRLWIPKHKFWVDVPIDEPDEKAIARITKKYNQITNFKQELYGENKSKNL